MPYMTSDCRSGEPLLVSARRRRWAMIIARDVRYAIAARMIAPSVDPRTKAQSEGRQRVRQLPELSPRTRRQGAPSARCSSPGGTSTRRSAAPDQRRQRVVGRQDPGQVRVDAEQHRDAIQVEGEGERRGRAPCGGPRTARSRRRRRARTPPPSAAACRACAAAGRASAGGRARSACGVRSERNPDGSGLESTVTHQSRRSGSLVSSPMRVSWHARAPAG